MSDFELTRSMVPYASLGIILGAAELFFLVKLCRDIENGKQAFPILLIAPAFWLSILWLGTRYRIWVKGDVIVRRTADFKKCSISFSEISKVVRETSNTAQLARMNRPMQRITIYGKNPKVDHLDVSLKHFKRESIKELMQLIHEKRPELEIPKGWI
jgi:ABC-type transport system involved in cytochrome bd biosynthesis fused ATPase/permease subunit